MDYNDFWVVAGTAAPVLGLAHALVIQPLLASSWKTLNRWAYLCAGIGVLLCVYSLSTAFNYLGKMQWAWASSNRSIESLLLTVSFVLVFIVGLLAGLNDDEEKNGTPPDRVEQHAAAN
jgi:hypothetical protein